MILGEILGEMKRLYRRGKYIGGVVLLWLIEVILVTVKISGYNSTQEQSPTHQITQEAPSTDPYTEPITEPETEEPTTEEVTELTTEEPTTEEPKWYLPLSEDELYALACIVWLEGGCESVPCQEAIASVVVNRYTTRPERYDDLIDVIYEPQQFSPAHLMPQARPTQTQIDVAYKIAKYGPTIPEYVTYFRADYYHDWGDMVSFMHMDNTYFSYSSNLKHRVESRR